MLVPKNVPLRSGKSINSTWSEFQQRRFFIIGRFTWNRKPVESKKKHFFNSNWIETFQFDGNWWGVFNHFNGLAFKGLTCKQLEICKNVLAKRIFRELSDSYQFVAPLKYMLPHMFYCSLLISSEPLVFQTRSWGTFWRKLLFCWSSIYW